MRDAQSKGNIENTNKYIYYVSTITLLGGEGSKTKNLISSLFLTLVALQTTHKPNLISFLIKGGRC